jgi:signal transduction histidine kinase
MDRNGLYQVSTPQSIQYGESLRQPDSTAQHQSATEGLEVAFSRIRREVTVEQHVMYRVILEGRSRPLHPLLQDEIYRIGREALVNAFRHSEASRVEIEIEYGPKRLRIAVRDNGKGISPDLLSSGSCDHRGLSWMRQQSEQVGAKLNVLSRVATGTEVLLSIPGQIAYEPQTGVRGLGLAFLRG